MLKKLQDTIDTIEANLHQKLDIQSLANHAGYSYYNYQHLFKDYVGMPIATYITRRRLEKALYQIQEGSPMTVAALDYGFDTYAGFYKAFVKQYGCSPKKYLALYHVGPTTQLDLIKESKKMLSKNEITHLLKNWNLEINSKNVSNLLENNQYVINEAYDLNGKYILKAGKNIPWMKTHVKVTKALRESGYECPYPIPTIEGQDYLIGNHMYYMVLHKVNGTFMSKDQRLKGHGSTIGSSYGNALGKLHQVLKAVEDELDMIDSNIVEILENWAIPVTRKNMAQWNMPLADSFYDNLVDLGFPLLSSIPKQLIHRDPNPGNIIFNKDQVEGFIDFEISESNIRIFDICYCATGNLIDLFEEEGGFDQWLKIYSSIVMAYNDINPLTDNEWQALPYTIFAIQLIFIAYLEDKPNLAGMLRQNREMLHLLVKNKDSLCLSNPLGV